MTTKLLDKNITVNEQIFILPKYYSWDEFIVLETLMQTTPCLRLTFLDGLIEFITLGENQETISRIIAFLLQLYLYEKGINFIPVGSATRKDQSKNVSFQPDESYYLNVKKEHPDLAIEITISSGGIDKLEK